jgi:hypothetical protein
MSHTPETKNLLTRLRGDVEDCYVVFEDEMIPYGSVIGEAIDHIERLQRQIDADPNPRTLYTADDINRVAAQMCALTLKISLAEALDLLKPIDRTNQTRQKKMVNDKLEGFQREQRRIAQVALETFGYRAKSTTPI